MQLQDRIANAYHEVFKESGQQPNALYLGREEYLEARKVPFPYSIIVTKKDIESPPEEVFMALRLFRVDEKHHLSVAYRSGD